MPKAIGEIRAIPTEVHHPASRDAMTPSSGSFEK
jgi:hypothetical protein